MSVSATVTPSISPRQATPDKRLPSALWHAVKTLAGDASAGTATITIQWPQVQGYLAFSVSVITAQVGGAAGNVALVELVATRMQSTDGNIPNPFFSTTLLNLAAVGAQGLVDMTTLPIFVPEIDGQWRIEGNVANPGAGNNFIMNAFGYLWDREALNLPGGPALPARAVVTT